MERYCKLCSEMEMRERGHINIQQVMVINLERKLQFALFVCLSLQYLMLLHKRLKKIDDK